MTCNILGRPRTKYIQKFHRAYNEVEDASQTRSRYLLAVVQITSTAADLVLLQECKPAFFEPEWNLAAQKLYGRGNHLRGR